MTVCCSSPSEVSGQFISTTGATSGSGDGSGSTTGFSTFFFVLLVSVFG